MPLAWPTAPSPNPGTPTRGAICKVVGLASEADRRDGYALSVRFDGNASNVALRLEDVSRERPPPLGVPPCTEPCVALLRSKLISARDPQRPVDRIHQGTLMYPCRVPQ